MTTVHDDIVLGLDIGTNSIGWALLDRSGARVVALGVRQFPEGVDVDPGSWRTESRSVHRRQARQLRRQTWRRAQRLRRVFRVLQRGGLLPAERGVGPEDRDHTIKTLDVQLAFGFPDLTREQVATKLPYLLRRDALDRPLEMFALGRALYHLAQRRGFLSNRKTQRAEGEDEDEGVVKEAIKALTAEMQHAGARTLGEYLAGLDPHAERLRSRRTDRAMYHAEFAAIWSAQAPHHSALTEPLRLALYRAIFDQRPLKSQRFRLGVCDLEPKRRRCPVADTLAQEFRLLQKVNDFQIVTEDGELRGLQPAERQTLIAALWSQATMTFAGVRRLLKHPKTTTYRLEAGGEEKLSGHSTNAKLIKVLGEPWLALPEDRRAGVVRLLRDADSDVMIKRGAVRLGFTEEDAANLAAVTLEPGYSAFSRAALLRLLPHMRMGVPYATAKVTEYPAPPKPPPAEDLPPVLQWRRSITNPAVLRSLTELRKVLNAIRRRYGKPGTVRIELARDLRQSAKERERRWKQGREREKERTAAKAVLAAECGLKEPSRADVEKYLLWVECEHICPYTGDEIPLRHLFGRAPRYDVEHILPLSRSLEDSFVNKTLCQVEENRTKKGNRTPNEAYHGTPQYDVILARVRKWPKSGMRDAKLERFQLKDLSEDFVSRQLNDTRYATRLAKDYVALWYGAENRVEATKGPLTAVLRSAWALNKILGDGDTKARDDHRHHAVDAATIAATEKATVSWLQRLVEQEHVRHLDGRKLPVTAPWPTFGLDVAHAVEGVLVSTRSRRRLRGGLHEETLYSPNGTQGARVRKPLARLTKRDVAAIVDDAVRAIVQAAVGDLEPARVFKDSTNLPLMPARSGRQIPIKVVRVATGATTAAVSTGSRERWVRTGDNHHMVVLAVTGAGGKVRCETHIVSRLEAYRRHRAGEPVVQREWGEGKQFVCSLATGDFIRVERMPGSPEVLYVVSVTGDRVEWRAPQDARTAVARRKAKARFYLTAGRLLGMNLEKLAADPLGLASAARD